MLFFFFFSLIAACRRFVYHFVAFISCHAADAFIRAKMLLLLERRCFAIASPLRRRWRRVHAASAAIYCCASYYDALLPCRCCLILWMLRARLSAAAR